MFNARQGVRYPVVEGQIVADPKTLAPVARNGETIGEIMVRGNTVMLGYLKDPKATAEAFRGGWMHTGDLAVEHPDGYVEIKDRAKDIIISGGENISSVEVEIALYRHPAVAARRRGGEAGREMGRKPVRLRATQARLGSERRRDHRVLPRPARAFQGAEVGRVRTAADDRDGEDPEVRAARAGAQRDQRWQAADRQPPAHVRRKPGPDVIGAGYRFATELRQRWNYANRRQARSCLARLPPWR